MCGSIDIAHIEQFYSDAAIFTRALDKMQTEIHKTAIDKGWWETDRVEGELIALCHSELSEALEAFRNGNPMDDKCPQFTNGEIELADTMIRIMDFAAAKGYNLSGAILAKTEFNKTRPHKHGGKKF